MHVSSLEGHFSAPLKAGHGLERFRDRDQGEVVAPGIRHGNAELAGLHSALNGLLDHSLGHLETSIAIETPPTTAEIIWSRSASGLASGQS